MNEEQITQEEEVKEEAQEERKANSGTAFYKQKLATVEQERLRLAEQLEAVQTQQLHEKESFKELYEREKQKRAEAEEKAKNLSQTVFNNFKISAIKEEALKAGILDSAIEDLDIIDNSIVEVETTDQGRINIHGARDFIEDLKSKKPHWFKKIGAPTINNGTPGEVPVKTLTAADIVKLEKTDPAKYKEIMNKRLGRA